MNKETIKYLKIGENNSLLERRAFEKGVKRRKQAQQGETGTEARLFPPGATWIHRTVLYYSGSLAAVDGVFQQHIARLLTRCTKDIWGPHETEMDGQSPSISRFYSAKRLYATSGAM